MSPPGALVRYIRRLVSPDVPEGDSDAGLLARFVAGGDDAAFTAVVARHGPMVLRTCRRVLGDAADAEDAFQATFLVLARKAAAVRPPEALAAWLHGVARRVSLKARSARGRLRREDLPLLTPPADPRPDPLAEVSVREMLTVIDEEVARLSEAQRLPVILCCLEGLSLDEAARALGWTTGSVKGRLERGRARLHARLARRGLAPAAALAVAEVTRVAGARVAVIDVTRDTPEKLDRWLGGAPELNPWLASSWRGPFPGQPPAATTGADGRFRLAGFGRDRVVSLTVEAPALAHTPVLVATRPAATAPFFNRIQPAAFDLELAPERRLRGAVRDEATGRPVAGVKISAHRHLSAAVTDAEGRYDLPGCPRLPRYVVVAEPPADQPYFAASAEVADQPGDAPLSADLALVSGTIVQGRVTSAVTGRPPPAARVRYYPLSPNPASARLTNASMKAAASAAVAADGTYRLVVLPGPGAVCVAAAPRFCYQPAAVDQGELRRRFPAGLERGPEGQPYVAHRGRRGDFLCLPNYAALELIMPREGAGPLTIDFLLRPPAVR